MRHYEWDPCGCSFGSVLQSLIAWDAAGFLDGCPDAVGTVPSTLEVLGDFFAAEGEGLIRRAQPGDSYHLAEGDAVLACSGVAR